MTVMIYHKKLSIIVVLVGTSLIVGIILTSPHAEGIRSSQQSISTRCLQNQSCQTVICNDNQPCYVFKSPNPGTTTQQPIEDASTNATATTTATTTTTQQPYNDPLEDYLDEREDMLDEREDMLDEREDMLDND